MGKPFSNELARISSTLAWAEAADVREFEEFAARAHGHLLVVIGAGGSFTAAEFTRLLHERRGGTAVVHTPLSFLQSEADLRSSFLVIFTASGGNRDVLATYRTAVEREPRGILIVCGRKGSKIERLATGDERTSTWSRPFPAGKDGYLATNSLAAFVALAVRAFRFHPGHERRLSGTATEWNEPLLPSGAMPDYYVTLFGGWARPAASDLESKFSEAGLGGVMLADYRNFAHGRHNWLHKRGARTAIVALISPDTEALAAKTLALLPAAIRIIRLSTVLPGPSGALDLLLQVFRLTAAVGQRVGIDPGRPGVPPYGRKIYHLGPVIRGSGDDAAGAAVARKLAARYAVGDAVETGIVTAAREEYTARLRAQRFGALVADFDGTVAGPGTGPEARLQPAVLGLLVKLLRADIPVFFATGRGDSIRSVMLRSFPKSLHPLVHISYFNGSVTATLADDPPTEQGRHRAAFDLLDSQLRRDPVFARATPANKGHQLTLKPRDRADIPLAASRLREVVLAAFADRFRVVESSHSLDVIPRETSKLACVRFAQSLLGTTPLLTIGDRGAVCGNDYDLLTHPFSLSVDQVSASLASCWNLLPAGVGNVSGFLHVGRSVRIKLGHFTLALD